MRPPHQQRVFFSRRGMACGSDKPPPRNIDQGTWSQCKHYVQFNHGVLRIFFVDQHAEDATFGHGWRATLYITSAIINLALIAMFLAIAFNYSEEQFNEKCGDLKLNTTALLTLPRETWHNESHRSISADCSSETSFTKGYLATVQQQLNIAGSVTIIVIGVAMQHLAACTCLRHTESFRNHPAVWTTAGKFSAASILAASIAFAVLAINALDDAAIHFGGGSEAFVPWGVSLASSLLVDAAKAVVLYWILHWLHYARKSPQERQAMSENNKLLDP